MFILLGHQRSRAGRVLIHRCGNWPEWLGDLKGSQSQDMVGLDLTFSSTQEYLHLPAACPQALFTSLSLTLGGPLSGQLPRRLASGTARAA